MISLAKKPRRTTLYTVNRVNIMILIGQIYQVAWYTFVAIETNIVVIGGKPCIFAALLF